MKKYYFHKDKDGSVWSDEAMICPYCEYPHTDNHEAMYDQSGGEFTCDECGEEFIVEPFAQWSWTTTPIKSDEENKTDE